MTFQEYKTTCIIIIIVIFFSCSPKIAPTGLGGEKVGETGKVKDDNINWGLFDPASISSKTEITNKQLQGLWKAYKGLFIFDGNVNTMNLTKPIIIEVKDSLYRRSLNADFKKFKLMDNLIISNEEATTDPGIINKITANELTITWKNKSNYTRYYYTK